MAYIVFFDGVCNLCNSSIDFIIRRDNRQLFKYASLQSTFAQNLLGNKQVDTSSMNTIILLKNDKIYYRSNAVLEIARELRFPWPMFYVFKIIPRFIRDWVYGVVSKNRYSWFGKRETCRMPTAEERALFLEEIELPSAEIPNSN